MFQKVHLRLTFMCAATTAAIMIVMSLLYLYLSEKGLYENQYASFQNDVSTIATSLEQQPVISMEWLSKMEARGGYTFYVLDNGIPFLYNQLDISFDDIDTRTLIDDCLTLYQNSFEYAQIADELHAGGLYNTCFHTEFPFHPAGKAHEYYAAVIELGMENAALQMVILSPLDFLKEQILQQRVRFLLIDVSATVLLALFAFFFTGRLLAPIEESRKQQAAFVAAASHELRTPLAVILSAAECSRNAEPARRDGFLDTIRQEGQLVTNLINDMLTLSASDNQRFSVHPAPVELDTLLMNTYEAFEPLAVEKRLSLSITLPEDAIPPCTADAQRILQLLAILLHNAVSYTPAGGSVTLSLLYKKNHFILSVADTGVGIAPEEQKRIFDRFYRAEKSRSAKGHFGLGLSIASEIVRLHHGTLTVESAPGKGSTFTVTLP